jgi:hypothetical protein
MIDTTRRCVHCGVVLLHPEQLHWCRMCQSDARDNHGVCRFCARDVAVRTNCWHVRRQMDQALIANQIPFMGGCPSCAEWNRANVEMEIVELTVSPRMKYLRMVCPTCQTRCETRYNLYRPPPAAGVRSPNEGE